MVTEAHTVQTRVLASVTYDHVPRQISHVHVPTKNTLQYHDLKSSL